MRVIVFFAFSAACLLLSTACSDESKLRGGSSHKSTSSDGGNGNGRNGASGENVAVLADNAAGKGERNATLLDINCKRQSVSGGWGSASLDGLKCEGDTQGASFALCFDAEGADPEKCFPYKAGLTTAALGINDPTLAAKIAPLLTTVVETDHETCKKLAVALTNDQKNCGRIL